VEQCGVQSSSNRFGISSRPTQDSSVVWMETWPSRNWDDWLGRARRSEHERSRDLPPGCRACPTQRGRRSRTGARARRETTGSRSSAARQSASIRLCARRSPRGLLAGPEQSQWSLNNYVFRNDATGPVLVAASLGLTPLEEANLVNPQAGEYTVYIHGSTCRVLRTSRCSPGCWVPPRPITRPSVRPLQPRKGRPERSR
jgi:hypothetical protein